MGKTIILNLSDFKLNGDVLDIGENFGVIYKICRDSEVDSEEFIVDFIKSESNSIIENEKYDICTMFFHLSSIWSNLAKESLIKEITKYIKPGGKIYIWDINKEIGKIFNNKIRVLLPQDKDKEFDFKNLNPLSKSDIEDTKKFLEDEFYIIEEKLWEDIYFLKCEKR